MKKYLIAVALIAAFYNVSSQTNLKINELSLPTSPGFVLLDKSPASIEKPTNPKALSLSLINIWEGNGAIEFTPYWLWNHPNYKFTNDIKNYVPFFQTFALSLASVKSDSVTNLAGGFRVQLLRKYADEDAIEAKRQEIVQALALLDTTKIQGLLNDMNDLRSKLRWNIELAGAYAGSTSTVSALKASRTGAWLNVRFTPNKFPLDFVALARYTSTVGTKIPGISDSMFFDYGISLSRQDKNYDIQFEYVNRRDFRLNKNYDRLTLVANYQIIQGIVVVASCGKDFTQANNVFTALGIKFGLSTQKVN